MCAVGYTQSVKGAGADSGTAESRQAQREQRHKMREERRAQRLAEYERYLDSLVLSHQFQFIPQDIQQQPAGPTRQLNNPNFQLAIWGSEVDVCLPYIKGVTPPYYYVVLNYTLPSVSNYLTEQTHDGWVVSFDTSLYSVTDYHFSLSIYTSSGSATLTISTSWYPDVEYDGTIISIN
ncbi:MAG: DUF4251 domain-containing protein [Alistipes sp.]|nr:DUF4251 domain-containing protein [Alistipes sp.]